MDNTRIMFKVKAMEHALSLSVFSRDYRSPSGFYLHENELIELEQKRYTVARNTNSYLTLRLYPGPDGKEVLKLEFLWLKEEEDGRLSGKDVEFQVSYNMFKDSIGKSYTHMGENQKMLSLMKWRRPPLEFCCRKNLKEAVNNPHICRKLGHFLGKNFLWPRSKSICFCDDFEPYSFGFSEKTVDGYELYGVVILHGRENMKKAYYSIHT